MLKHILLTATLLGGSGLLVTIAPIAQAKEARAAQTKDTVAVAPDPMARQEAQVTIDNFTFSPAQVTVAAGTRVTWINRDDIPHTVTDSAEPRAMKSMPLDTGDSFAFTFDKPGTYRYFCSLHPHMQGTVVVR